MSTPHLDKALASLDNAEHGGGNGGTTKDRPPVRRLRVTSLDEVATARMRFLWKNTLPLGAVSVFAGRGGCGKSTFALWLAGQVNHGTLPGDLYGQPADVLMVSHEDPLSTVLVPRAIANGCDLAHIHQFAVESEDMDGAQVPKLPMDIGLLRKAIEKTGAKVIIVDPITSTLEGDNDKLHDVRSMLDPLAILAEDMNVSVIAIAHFRKGSSGVASDFLSGSHGWRDAARALLLFAVDKETGETILTLEKGNYSESQGSFAMQLVSERVPTDDGESTEVGRVDFLGSTNKTVAEVVAMESGPQFGETRSRILNLVKRASSAVSVEDIQAELPNVPANTIRQNLTRLVKGGDLIQEERGRYAPAHPVAQRDLGANVTDDPGLSQVSQVSQTAPNVTDVTLITPPRARAEKCLTCGKPLHPALVASGQTTHSGCSTGEVR